MLEQHALENGDELVIHGVDQLRSGIVDACNDHRIAMMAAVVVISVPLIVLFLVFRNKVMEGVSRGGIKG